MPRASLLLLLLAFAAFADEAAFLKRLASVAAERSKLTVAYDPAYVKLRYPGGDVPADRGVCTDVVIRSYRALGVDLQKLVHEDMAAHFKLYPPIFGLRKPDANIDHRRVPNLEVFFRRKGKSLAPSAKAGDYAPGELVTWNLPSGRKHIGVVTDRRAPSGNWLVMHNIGEGDVLEDVLFAWELTGHFRYTGP